MLIVGSSMALFTIAAVLVCVPALAASLAVALLSGLLIWRPGWTRSTTSVVPSLPLLGVPAAIVGGLTYLWAYQGIVASLRLETYLPLVPTAALSSVLIALSAWGTARWFAFVARDTAALADPREGEREEKDGDAGPEGPGGRDDGDAEGPTDPS